MPDTINTHLAIGLILGAFVLGYLLAEWYFDSLLEKTDTQLSGDATTIEELVASNDAANSLIEKLQSNIQVMDENATVLLKKNTELQRTADNYREAYDKLSKELINQAGASPVF